MSAPSVFAAGAPPSMPAGSHEIRDYYNDQNPPRSLPHTAPSVTPYLGLRARLSQIWINRWTILFLLVLARSLIALSGIDNNLSSARREALSACSDVESMGSAMASMPHYMSQGVNELTATGIEKSVNGLIQMSTMSITAVEEIVVFVIGMMTNTYLCLITFAVTGSLHSVLNSLDLAQKGLNDLTKGLGDDLSGAVKTFEDAYNSFIGKLGSFVAFGQTVDQPKPLNLDSEMTALKNLTLPANLDADIKKLNSSIPTFDQVKNFTETVLRLPFEEVKTLMNEYMGNYTFNRSLFPVPQKEQLSFCSDDNGINDFFDGMVDLAALARRVFIAVLLTLAILVMIPMAWREIKRYQTMQERSQLVNSNAQDPMDVVYMVSRPYTSTAGVKLSNTFQSQRKKDLIRWVVAYATSDAALFVLALAIAGLLSCACQAILLHLLEKEVPDLTNQVGAFSGKVVATLNNASEQWAIGTNAAIAATNKDINQNMLGWVGTSTNAVNDTLAAFVDETTKVLNETFGGTILHDPIMEVLNCLVLLKVQGVEKGLTWVHDNAHIDFPLLPNNTFTLGAVASLANSSDPSDSFLASPGDTASDKISSAVTRVIDELQNASRTEAIISTVILLVWVFVVFVAIVRALTLWQGRDKVRGEGGASAYPSDATTGNDFRSDNQDRYVGFADVPLTNVNKNRPVSEPAPEYTPSEKDTTHEDDYQESKLGFHDHESLQTDNKRGYI